jgi:hypothetical protein
MATPQASAENTLDVIVFVPPKSNTEIYGLLRALDVKGAKNGLVNFSALHAGIDEDFLISQKMEAKLPLLRNFLQNAKESELNDVNVTIDKHNATDGSLGCTITDFSKGKAKAGVSIDSEFQLKMSNMKMRKIPPTRPINDFLDNDCVLAFAKECNEIQSHFKRKPTSFSGDIEYGVAFVTATMTGETTAVESCGFHAGVEFEAIGTTSSVAIDASEKAQSSSRGVVGVLVHFILLVKTKNNPNVRIKQSFPVRKSCDKNLQHVLGSMMTKFRRKIMGPQIVGREPVAGMAMVEGYDSSGDYNEDIETLTEIADDQAYEYVAMDTSVEQTYTASLRILGGSDTGGRKPVGRAGDTFDRSNNMLYHSTIADLEEIRKSINDHGSCTIGKYIVDGIKPVIKVNFKESLPVVYDWKLSGACVSDAPGWVLRADLGGKLIMLWKVSGVEQGSGIVTAYQDDWHVRESREYLDATEKEAIDQLKSEGFFQLDPAEIDPNEVEIAKLESGSLVMMGRQILALKEFEGDEVNDIAQETSTTSAPGSSAAASLPTESSETPEAIFGPRIVPVVTKQTIDVSPQRVLKKSRNEFDS